jgi:murein DD-endopeptidase MepM/ murein hydrolase activator NlpD
MKTDQQDYGARFYDPQIGRWTTTDLVSELFFSISSYVYCLNNPLKYIDYKGLWPTKKVVDNGTIGNRGFNLTQSINPANKSLKTKHLGQDFPVSSGNNVHALAGGKVIAANFQFNDETKLGWGYYIDIQHSNGYVTRYAHLTKDSFKFKIGQPVNDGDIIALSGASGGVSGPHLHIEMLLNGKHIDPMAIADLQILLNELNGLEGEAMNEVVLGEVIITANRTKSQEDRIMDMLFQSIKPNASGNTGRYNKPGRTSDQNYSDQFLHWYYFSPENENGKK